MSRLRNDAAARRRSLKLRWQTAHLAMLLFFLLWLAAAVPAAAQQGVCTASSGPRTQPLVELYTSEGCSSCPPADRWLSSRFAVGEANYLAFHVDYWDSLGWPDPFASAAFSARQRLRVAAAGERTVYTPQVMVGDVTRAGWNRETAWSETLRQARRPAAAAISVRLIHGRAGWRAALGAASIEGVTPGAKLWLARHVDARTTKVRAGENRGSTLRHDRVVRELFGPWPLGDAAISYEVGLIGESVPWGVTAFVQNHRGDVLQSLSLDAAACDVADPA